MKKNRESSWSRLDNAAKIFPPNSNKRDTKVFRFTCRLKEEINALKVERKKTYRDLFNTLQILIDTQIEKMDDER